MKIIGVLNVDREYLSLSKLSSNVFVLLWHRLRSLRLNWALETEHWLSVSVSMCRLSALPKSNIPAISASVCV